jgi:1,4-alpha-glucan branching enzyme
MAGDTRVDTGFKYYRITGPTPWKEPYHPHAAREKAALHAGEFFHKRLAHLEYLSSMMETRPIVVAPFDAELFGHWWFEGPQWLDFVIRKMAFDQDAIRLTTLSAYLDQHPLHQLGTPCTSSWGHKGYFETWLNDKTDWIYTQLNGCGKRMESLANRYKENQVPALTKRALNQCLRELLLAQSSDWPFIISNGTSEEYASRRVKDHVSRFYYLADAIDNKTLEEKYLNTLEEMDNLFPSADYRVFC